MTRQEQLKECREELTNCMEKVGSTRCIWQNNAVWWICKTLILLVNKEIKDESRVHN